MTPRQKLKAEEKKKKKYYQCGGKCYTCGDQVRLDACQFAHKIAKSKANYSKYGKEVIDHILNGEITCAKQFGRCNDAVNIGNNPGKTADILVEIYKDLEK